MANLKTLQLRNYVRQISDIYDEMTDFVSNFDDGEGDRLADDEQEDFNALIRQLEDLCERYNDFRRLSE
jgi:hypothetical protein